MNELLLFVEIIVIFSLLVLVNKFFKKEGMFVWISIACILANIQVMKSIDLFGISSALGNVLFASTFLATDIISECYGAKESKKAVLLSVIFTVLYFFITQITLLFVPNNMDVNHNNMVNLFSFAPRVCISSVAMYFIANIADVHIYDKLRKKFNGKKMWLRNNITTILCNSLENFGFTFLAFAGIYPIQTIFLIALSGSIIETIIAIFDTPFLYWAKAMHEKEMM